MTIAIEKTANRYDFYAEDEDGKLWDLGHATMNEQDNGDDENYIWYEGSFDTRSISFYDDDDLIRNIKRRKPHEDVYFL